MEEKNKCDKEMENTGSKQGKQKEEGKQQEIAEMEFKRKSNRNRKEK